MRVFPRRNCTKAADLLGLSRTCSHSSCRRAWPSGQRCDARLASTHFFPKQCSFTDALRQRSRRRIARALLWVQSGRQVYLEPHFSFRISFSRILPGINSGHIVRRHTSKGRQGTKVQKPSHASCTESWADRGLARLFEELAAELAAQPAAQWGFGSRHGSGMWSLALAILAC